FVSQALTANTAGAPLGCAFRGIVSADFRGS
ncbi:hypothetical protein AB7M70_000001, partial [Bradyrhizobium japonicum]